MNKLIAGIFAGIALLPVILLVSLLYALPVMILWNWLLPDIFGIKEINLWQAIGLCFLSSLLIKSGSSKSSD